MYQDKKTIQELNLMDDFLMTESILHEETAQRVLLRLTARRGGFAPLPEYGSRLYLLPRTAKPSGYETAARQYIAEALAEEPAVEVTAVRFTPVGADGVRIDVDFTAGGAAFTGAVTV